jgi:hypothetical protein
VKRRHSGFAGVARRVHTDHGSHVEPELVQSWSDLDKLRWHAAVVEQDTGLTIEVGLSDHRIKRPGSDRWEQVHGEYRISVVRPGVYSSGMAFRFVEAWAYLNGVCDGAGRLPAPTV